MAIVLALFALMLSGCDIGYLAHSACSEVHLLWNRKPIDTVLAKPDLAPEVRAKLEMVLQVRHFAASAWVSTSAAPTRPSRKWTMPRYVGGDGGGARPLDPIHLVVSDRRRGSIQGLFQQSRGAGCGRFAGSAGAGHFHPARGGVLQPRLLQDPLLSNLLGLDRVVLAGVIIHELFHRTYFLASNVMFDESAANYVGSRGAVAFFDDLKGVNSEEAAQRAQCSPAT